MPKGTDMAARQAEEAPLGPDELLSETPLGPPQQVRILDDEQRGLVARAETVLPLLIGTIQDLERLRLHRRRPAE